MKGLTKSALFAVLMIVLGATVTVAPAHAATGNRVSVNIPFDFFVGDVSLKQGSYTVEQPESGILTFSSNDRQVGRYTLAIRGESANRDHQPKLVFVRYGTQTFLSQVFMSAENDCNQLPRSRREKNLSQTIGDELSLIIQPVR
jgi:hypothetical protein